MFDRWANAFSVVFTPKILLFLGQGLLNTLYIAAVSIILSLIFGTILGLMRNSKGKPIQLIATLYIEIVRNIPLTLFVISMRFMTKLPPLESGIAAMTVFTSAIVAEIVRGGLNSIGKGQWEAATSQGFSHPATLWHIIIPQALQRIRSPLISQFVTTIKDTSFCAVVGTYELSFTSKIVAAHRTIVTAEDILVLYLVVAFIYYIINRTFSGIARRERGNAMKGVVR
ncbi:MAG TPA: amino acid ABC transporter permease [Candidatus Limiplasma sp.]|nr:amino acid ABC transporter permease [Candidatus Limiplasma sp.]HPS81033.1 amino acid ABC transporter permease [Candidatus Limiplasma sp.]